jgi:hypothetical protein
MIGSNENGRPDDIPFKADLTFERLQPRLEQIWQSSQIDPVKRHDFEVRLQEQWRPLFRLLYQLYGTRYDFFYHVERVVETAAQAWMARSDDLCELDRHRTGSWPGHEWRPGRMPSVRIGPSIPLVPAPRRQVSGNSGLRCRLP